MKKFIIIVLVLLTVFNIFSMQVITNAKDIDENKSFNEPYLFIGNKLDFKGKTTDLFLLAKTLDFTGDIGSDFIGFANYLNLSGNIGHNVIAGANVIDIEKNINGTVFLAGDKINFGKNSIVNGSIFIGSGSMNVLGKIVGDVYIGTGRLVINGEINGNVKVYAGKISISDNGKINGNVEYHTEFEMSKEELSKINGNVQFFKENHKYFGKDKNFFEETRIKEILLGIKIAFLIISLLSFIIAGLLLLLFPGLKRLEEDRTRKNFWFNSLFGLIPLFIYPTCLILSIVFVITIPLSFVLLFAIMPVILITQILGVTMIGQFLFNIFKWNNSNRFLYFLFGSIFFVLLSCIPFLNFIMGIFSASLGAGFILEMLFRKKLG